MWIEHCKRCGANYWSDELFIPCPHCEASDEKESKIPCECGSHAVGSSFHSTWCPKSSPTSKSSSGVSKGNVRKD